MTSFNDVMYIWGAAVIAILIFAILAGAPFWFWGWCR